MKCGDLYGQGKIKWLTNNLRCQILGDAKNVTEY